MRLRWQKKFLNLTLKFIKLILSSLIFSNGCNESNRENNYSVERDFVKVGVLKLFTPKSITISFEQEVEIDFNDISKQNIIINKPFKIETSKDGCFIIYNGNNIAFTKMYIKTRNHNEYYGDFLIIIDNKINRKYHGGFEVVTSETGFNLIVKQKIEDMVYSSLSSEGNDDQKEYLKALAIVIRTYVIKNINRHKSEGFDFCDNTHCQLFFGETRKNPYYLQAVKETNRLILTYNGEPVDIFFCGSCGGATVPPQIIWKNYITQFPYKKIECPYCRFSKYYSWNCSISKKTILEIFNIGRTNKDVKLNIEYGPDSIPKNIILYNGYDKQYITADDFRIMVGRNSGWNKILSNKFSLKEDSISVNKESFSFEGKGFGHCVGFCQSGAEEMAKNNFLYDKIISFYYPDCLIRKISK
jgi:stage II sporulation protein D